MLSHTGGTYSHSGVIDYPRFPISELHLGKFPDSMEFQSWKVNFKTEIDRQSIVRKLAKKQAQRRIVLQSKSGCENDNAG